MSKQPTMVQEEKLLYLKYSRITKSFLDTVVADILRVRLYQCAQKRRQSVREFLGTHKQPILSALQNLKRFTILVFPPDNASPYLHFWNFRLLCKVLRSTKCLSVQEDNDVKYMLDVYIRLFEHYSEAISGLASRHGTKAKQEYVGICSAVQRLVDQVGDHELIKAVKNFTCNVETGPGDVSIDSKLVRLYMELEETECYDKMNPESVHRGSQNNRSKQNVQAQKWTKAPKITFNRGNRPKSSVITSKNSNTLKAKEGQQYTKVDILKINHADQTGKEVLACPGMSSNLHDIANGPAGGLLHYHTVPSKKGTTLQTARANKKAREKSNKLQQQNNARSKPLQRRGSTSSNISLRKSVPRYVNSPYLQTFKPIHRSHGLKTLTSGSENQPSKNTIKLKYQIENRGGGEQTFLLLRRSTSAGSLSDFMRKHKGVDKGCPTNTTGINTAAEVREVVEEKRCPSACEGSEHVLKVQEISAIKSPTNIKRKKKRMRPQSARSAPPKYSSGSRPQSARSTSHLGTRCSTMSRPQSARSTSHLGTRCSTMSRPQSARSTSHLGTRCSTMSRPQSARHMSSSPWYSILSMPHSARRASISSGSKVSPGRTSSSQLPSGIKSRTTHFTTSKTSLSGGVFQNVSKPQKQRTYSRLRKTQPINNKIMPIKIPTDVTTNGEEDYVLNTHETSVIKNANADENTKLKAHNDMVSISNTKQEEKTQSKAMPELSTHIVDRANSDNREDDECMKRIINDVIVHQQVHSAAKHPKLNDIDFVNRFFSFLRQNAITKKFLRTENIVPHKTWHLPDGTKAKFTFLPAFVFRHIDESNTPAHFLVLKVLHRLTCRHEIVKESKSDTDVLNQNPPPPSKEKRISDNSAKKAKDQQVSVIKQVTKQRPPTTSYPRGRPTSKATKGGRSRSQSHDKPNNSIGAASRSSSVPRKEDITSTARDGPITDSACWKCQQKNLAMTICVNWKNRHICRLLNQEGVPYREAHLIPAVKANDLDILQHIVNFLKVNSSWNPGNECPKTALYLARYHRLTKIVRFLEKEGVKDERQIKTPACGLCRWF